MFVVEALRDSWTWWRIADKGWKNPLDPTFAGVRGGRWNPENSFDTLYLNEDKTTARHNLRNFIEQWPYEPEDLRSDNGPVIVGAHLPKRQTVCDCHSSAGLKAANLPQSYPIDSNGNVIPHQRCQKIGQQIKDNSLRGVRSRSAQIKNGLGRELAWYPATKRSKPTTTETIPFETWYWG